MFRAQIVYIFVSRFHLVSTEWKRHLCRIGGELLTNLINHYYRDVYSNQPR